MRAAMVEGKMKLAIREMPEPSLDKDEVLIRVQYCGICGSDIHRYKWGAALGIGHEFSGDIVKVGPNVTSLKVGDRVAVEPHHSCGECYWCRQGAEIGLCEEFYLGIERYQGAFRTHVKAREYQVHKLPDNMSYEQAALIEPTTISLHAVKLSEMKEGDTVAVLGLGPIGQLVARVARALGAGQVYATEASRSRIELARGVVDEVIDINATDPVDRIMELTQGRGADVVFECAGSIATAQQSLALVRKGGTIVAVSICFDWVDIPFSSIVLKGLTLKGFVCWSVGDYESAMKLIGDGKIDVDPLLTCRMPLADINEAFEQAMRGEGGTILIKP
ncbi:MAG: alcohol dehydrogenase catalytic domain-containing protein [Dehalococcoidia bacterium]|nr:MAG: alcohol dehydrogenase catalytic domain-containing protein [Dehalococcoidia bacterium]